MASSPSSLIATLSAIDTDTFENGADRAQVADALLAAMRRVQTPWHVAFEHGWAQPALVTAIKTLIDAGFWSKWVANGGHTAHVSELSRITGVDAVLLGRLLRCVAAEKLLLEDAEETYTLTPFTTVLGSDAKFASVYSYMFHTNFPVFQHFPKFAAESGYKNPHDASHGNFQSWAGDGENIFTFYAANPNFGQDFGNAMTINANSKTPWPSIYPSSKITTDAKPDRVLVVDVGGSVGHDLQKFFAEKTNVPDGSLVVQDLPRVIESATLQAPLVAQAHDFFQPQPIKGARAYYMHCVLHDWPEPEAIKILENLAAAMEKGYSRVLIHEIVVKARGGHRYEAASDLTMMFAASAAERTEAIWRDLVAKAGLVVTKIWTTPEAVESIIEIELP